MSEAPEAGAEAPAPEPVETPASEAPQAAAAPDVAEAGDPPAGEAPEAVAAPEEPKKPKSPVAQLQGRVGHLTKTIHQKDEALGEAQKQIDAYKALLAAQGRAPEGEGTAPPAAAQPTPTPGTAEFDRLIDERASLKARQTAFTEASNRVYDEGLQKHGDSFKEGVANLNALGMMNAEVVQAAIATGSPADVLNALGADVDEAARITALPPVAMAVELTKLAGKLSTREQPQISRAPAPIAPVGSVVRPDIDLAKTAASPDMASYVAARKTQGSKWAR